MPFPPRPRTVTLASLRVPAPRQSEQSHQHARVLEWLESSVHIGGEGGNARREGMTAANAQFTRTPEPPMTETDEEKQRNLVGGEEDSREIRRCEGENSGGKAGGDTRH